MCACVRRGVFLNSAMLNELHNITYHESLQLTQLNLVTIFQYRSASFFLFHTHVILIGKQFSTHFFFWRMAWKMKTAFYEIVNRCDLIYETELFVLADKIIARTPEKQTKHPWRGMACRVWCKNNDKQIIWSVGVWMLYSICFNEWISLRVFLVYNF